MPYNYEKKQLESIKELEQKLENAKLYNARQKFLLELNRGFINSKKILPYIIATAVTFSSFSLFYSIPFIKDTRRQNLWYKKEIDSNGNIAVEEQYQKMDNPSEISYISEWQKSSDNYYVRNITTYRINALNEQEIEELVLKKDVSLSSILGEPVMNKVERKNSVSEEELNQKGFIRAIIYDESIDKYAYIEESSSVNNQATLFWIIITACLYGINYAYAINKGNDKIREQLNNINRKYAPLDIEILTRKLEIRNDTLKRMK